MVTLQRKHLTITNKDGTVHEVPAIVADSIEELPVYTCRVTSLSNLPPRLVSNGSLIFLNKEDDNNG